ncbi:formylmethanofuran dehydrogenase subunit C [Methanolobus halotolerans]|uniref:formylmethanofuran dehydrogenase n=1 Tax=Methanolobus halotolerans TaxID=2052935 RepID=A0A4E0Q3Z8_9EURY|nr:formylmethanofuran dehydrogenase subunit C [Methanolobus halotolerans]TGC08335.1 formylmethanofuran dehydrogenase subunit C [Methanolobus halotolerans]
MAEVILKPTGNFNLTVEGEVITPDNFAGKNAQEIGQLLVWQGPQEYPLSNYFEVKGDGAASAEKTSIIIDGDVTRVKRIGEGMTAGRILVKGSTGMHVGADMKGGEIIVEGDTDSWPGMEMKGGLLHIKGNTKDHVGSAYRGSWNGMTGGRIVIDGDAINQVGGGISGGEIIIGGNVKHFCGIRINGGLIVVKGNATRAVGAEMTGGTIVVGGTIERFTPGFELAEVESDLKFNDIECFGEYKKFTGDYAIPQKGKGTLYVSCTNNECL